MPEHVIGFDGYVRSVDREALLGQRAVTLWLTGLSGAGKSTIACAVERRLISMGRCCYVLDGDNVRRGLSRDLGFSSEARRENIRRVSEVAKLMNDAGLIVITALISPLHSDRAEARKIIGGDRFLEIHISTSLKNCQERDPKGLYAKALRGEIPSFTGISAPYESPSHPDLTLDGHATDIESSVTQIIACMAFRLQCAEL